MFSPLMSLILFGFHELHHGEAKFAAPAYDLSGPPN